MIRKLLAISSVAILAIELAACAPSAPSTTAPSTTTPPAAAASTPQSTADTINSIAGTTEATVCGAFGAYFASKGTYQPSGALLTIQETLATFCSGSPVVGSTPTATLVNLALDGAKLIAAKTLAGF